jgi:hypothetical protein
MDKLLANERVFRALITQAAQELSEVMLDQHDETWDWLTAKEQVNRAMQSLVIATAVAEELWRTDIYRASRAPEEPEVTATRE